MSRVLGSSSGATGGVSKRPSASDATGIKKRRPNETESSASVADFLKSQSIGQFDNRLATPEKPSSNLSKQQRVPEKATIRSKIPELNEDEDEDNEGDEDGNKELTEDEEVNGLGFSDSAGSDDDLEEPSRVNNNATRSNALLAQLGINSVEDQDANEESQTGVPNYIPVTKTQMTKVFKVSMKKTWISLHPQVINMIVSALDVYIEQAILTSGVTLTDEQKHETRALLKKMMSPVTKKFKTLRLPPNVSEFQLDEERLVAEKNRLNSSVSASLEQSDGLKEEYLVALNELEKEEKLFRELRLFYKGHQKVIEERMKVLENDMKEGLRHLRHSGVEVVSDEINNLSAEKINLNSLKVDNLTKQTLYDPEQDSALKEVLAPLDEKLDLISDNLLMFNRLSETMDRVTTLLDLAIDI